MSQYDYIGKGNIYAAPYSGGKLRNIGNCSRLSVSTTEEEKELLDYQNAGGGQANKIRRITQVGLALTLHDLSPENLALALYGASSAIAEATVTDELIAGSRVHKGGLIQTASPIKTSVNPVVTSSPAGTTYVKGTDWDVVPAGILILAGGSINDNTPLLVDYTKRKSTAVEAFTQAQGAYKLVFDGLNEAQSNLPVVITIHNAKFGAARGFGLIADDFAALELEGEALSDSAITTVGLSKYMKIVSADPA
jgi:hypothetical protein